MLEIEEDRYKEDTSSRNVMAEKITRNDSAQNEDRVCQLANSHHKSINIATSLKRAITIRIFSVF